MNKKIKIVIVIILSILILVATYFIKQINKIYAPSFVIINGYDGRLYKICLKIFISVAIIGIITISITTIRKKWKKLLIGLAVFSALVLLLFVGYQGNKLVSGWNSFHKTPYIVSPDGKHALYQDGGDRDIFGQSSGQMHYAMKCNNKGYARVFFCDEENFTPQITWYENGFFVSYYCPECTKEYEHGYDVAPESDFNMNFQYERREDGIFFYYDTVQ